MSSPALVALAIAIGTTAGVFLSLVLTAAAMIFQVVEAESVRTRTSVHRLIDLESFTLRAIPAGTQGLFPDDFGDTLLALVRAWDGVKFDRDTMSGNTIKNTIEGPNLAFHGSYAAFRIAFDKKFESLQNPGKLNPAAEAIRSEEIARLLQIDSTLFPLLNALYETARSAEAYALLAGRWREVRHVAEKSPLFGAYVVLAFVIASIASITSFGIGSEPFVPYLNVGIAVVLLAGLSWLIISTGRSIKRVVKAST